MFATIQKFFHDISTGVDNKTFDIGRVVFLWASALWCLSMVVFLVAHVYIVFALHDPARLHEFGHEVWYMMVGGAAIHVGACAGLGLKASTEPGVEWMEGEQDTLVTKYDSAMALPWEMME